MPTAMLHVAQLTAADVQRREAEGQLRGRSGTCQELGKPWRSVIGALNSCRFDVNPAAFEKLLLS